MTRVSLGEVWRLTGDVLIGFHGEGKARFRVQHTRDREGQPAELGWCDVSAIYNRSFNPQAVIDRENGVRGFLVDQIISAQEVTYRRQSADWLRVIPFDEDDATREGCGGYAIHLQAAS
jgi:hypothetical protein